MALTVPASLGIVKLDAGSAVVSTRLHMNWALAPPGITEAFNQSTEFTYDNNGNLATVTDRKSQVTTYTYDPLNRRTKATFHDGTSTHYTYDAGNRLTQVQEKDASQTVTATITRTCDGLDRCTGGKQCRDWLHAFGDAA